MNDKVGTYMIQSYLESLIIECLLRIKGERTVYSVFHLITGKKSSQTIQDGHLFGFAQYYRTYTSLTREDYGQIITTLQDKGLLILKQSNGEYELQSGALEALQQYRTMFPLVNHVNGLLFHGKDQQFWKRFSLIFQVLSQNVHGNNKYFTVQREKDIQMWVKSFLYRQKDWKSLSVLLYAEMKNVLSTMPEIHGQVFLLKLSGYHRVGYSNEQIARMLDMEESYVHYLFLDVLHKMLSMAGTNSLPILAAISELKEKPNQLPLTRSTLTTLSYLKRGYTIEEIAQARGLKSNTIEDHIVEMVFHGENIDLASVITNEQIQMILDAAERVQTRQLRVLKQELPDSISYFLIRLALAKGETLS